MDTSYSNRIHEVGGVRALSTVLRTLAVLDVLAESNRPMRLPEIAAAIGVSRPTTYQRLHTLVEAGLIEQGADQRYRIALRTSRLASAALEQADLGTRIQPTIEKLVHQVRETASLAVLDRGLPCIIARVDSESLLRAEQKIGTTLSLEGSASGRVLTAFANASTLEKLIASGMELPAPDILQECREKGYALSSGYTQSGVIAIAAPIFDHLDQCIATLSLVLPQTRFDLEAFRAPLLAHAEEISAIHKGKRR